MSNILQELEAEIKKATAAVSQENVGVIRSVGDGVAKIEGLSGVMLNEMLEFPGGVMGLAMNLEEHEVGAVILGDDSDLKEGDIVKCTGPSSFRSRGPLPAWPRGEYAGRTD